jgi:hypothetical protein
MSEKHFSGGNIDEFFLISQRQGVLQPQQQEVDEVEANTEEKSHNNSDHDHAVANFN